MTRPIAFFVPGIPKGQPRPRAFARKIGGKYVARVFEAGTAEQWKSQIATAWKESGATMMEVPACSVLLSFQFPRPKHHSTAKGVLKPDAPVWHTAKPDVDNTIKAVLDALTQIGAWKDDAIVASIVASKLYSPTPGCHIEIHPMYNP